MVHNTSGDTTRLMRESREHSVSHNTMRAGTWRALQVRARETMVLGLIAKRSAAICAANSSSLKTRVAMLVVAEDARGDRGGGS